MKRLFAVMLFAVFFFQNGIAQNKYDDKIVFSKSPIPETPDDSKLTDKFEFGETVYARFFLSNPLLEYKGVSGKYNDPGYDIILSIDDKESKEAMRPHMFTEQNKNSQTYDFKFVYSNKQENTLDVLLSPEIMNPLSVGEHKIKLKIVRERNSQGKSGKTMIEKGEFTIVKSDNAKKIKNKTFADVVSGMKDPKLEAKAIANITEWLKQNTDVGTLQKQECKILGKDWMIYHHPSSGAIMSRDINIAFLLKKPNGNCQLGIFCFKQTYTGSGFQETLVKVPISHVTDYEVSLQNDYKRECE